MVHSPEKQLLSLSPSPNPERNSSQVTEESFANLYDDGSDRQPSQSGTCNTIETQAINAIYTPFYDCPIVTHDLYIPLPNMIRGYITLPENTSTQPPYPLRKRQPESRRLERAYHSLFESETSVMGRGSPPFRRTTKRHSLASGQIDRLVHARRGATAQIQYAKEHQNKSDTGVLRRYVVPSSSHAPPPPPPPPPPNNEPYSIAFNASDKHDNISPAVSPPRHPFER
ncbi:hypothetical protein K492DRAFT_198662 [Lichtheimia hyalospora FSU 10163]|nr:hypothetical protein K492DRAFT_198662 [Lichtheimia hyalospora FSU 10163]